MLPLDFDALRALAQRGSGSDRAYVDALLRMAWARTTEPAARTELELLHGVVRAASLQSHSALRAELADASLRGAALRRRFEAVPFLERDHFVEEALGMAYPPLDEVALRSELMAYVPSGYDEICYAFEACQLGPDDEFLDLGSGAGKVTLLAALLTGAKSRGVEHQLALHEVAENAARQLSLGSASFEHGDARAVQSEHADVVFMYLPFSGSVLDAVLARLAAQTRAKQRRRYLCAGALDLKRYTELTAVAEPKSWLHVYAWR